MKKPRQTPDRKPPAAAGRRSAAWLAAGRSWIERNRVLTAIVAAALVLRAANLLWGVPLSPYVQFYHGDEAKAWTSAAAFPEIYLGSTNYLYGTAVQYAVGLLMFPAKILMVYLLGRDEAFQLATVIVFRLVNVLLSTATVALTCLLGQRLRSQRAGLVAAALLAVAFGPVLHSALTTLDVSMAFLLTVAVLQVLRALEQRRTIAFVVLGVLLGLLCGTKITGVLYAAAVVAWMTWSLAVTPRTEAAAGQTWNWPIIVVCLALAVFFISTPHIFLDWREYLKFMQQQKQQWYDAAALTFASVGRAWWTATAAAIGAPAAILAAAGLPLAERGRGREHLLIILLIAATYGFWLGYLLLRFVLPVVPLLCVLAGLAIDRFLGASRPLLRQAGAALFALTVGWSLVVSSLGIAQKWADPRTRAARFIDRQLPAGASLGIAVDHGDAWQHHGWRYPRIDFSRFRETRFVDRPEYVVTTSLELDSMRPALADPHLLADGSWDPRYRQRWYLGQPPPREIIAFFQDLLAGKDYEEFAVFRSAANLPIDGACPAVFVYRRRP